MALTVVATFFGAYFLVFADRSCFWRHNTLSMMVMQEIRWYRPGVKGVQSPMRF